MKTTLLIASNNRGKLEEIRPLLSSLDVHITIPADWGINLEVVEDGSSYRQNAALKAVAFRNALRALPQFAHQAQNAAIVLADDSGLEVEALDGAPGIHSARFAPQPGATDRDRRNYLLLQLQSFARPWKAHFNCTLAILDLLQQEPYFIDGQCRGEIIPEERGDHGFGYDPIFFLPELGRTMAELSMDEKNRLSHRARAVLAALPRLKIFLQENH